MRFYETITLGLQLMRSLLPLNRDEAAKLAAMMCPEGSPCEQRQAARRVEGKVIADAIRILQKGGLKNGKSDLSAAG
jgi:hypothetical protein